MKVLISLKDFIMLDKSILDFLHFGHPTEEQKNVLLAFEKFVNPEDQHDFMILSGAAGTGKTSISSALIGYLNHFERPYYIAAPTGRAARMIGRKANTTSSTIHSIIYSPSTDKETGKTSFKIKIGYNGRPTLYIIDEASMISRDGNGDNELFTNENGLIFDLIKYIKEANVNNKIIFIGDNYQLPPIGETESSALSLEFLEKIFNLKGIAFALTEVKRQVDGSYILENATDIRKAIDEKKATHPIKGKKSKNIFELADNYVKELRSNGLDNSIAIGVSHKSNKLFNDLVRERIFKNAKIVLQPGDLLMVNQNWKRAGQELFNGDHVIVDEVDWKVQEEVAGLHFVAIRIKPVFNPDLIIEDYVILESIINPGGRIEIEKEKALRIQRFIKNKIFQGSELPSDDKYVGALRLIYGHAITCNKAQGGEWKKVFINTWGIPSLKWQYTAVTRGIDEIESA
jgi:hypothetical protein